MNLFQVHSSPGLGMEGMCRGEKCVTTQLQYIDADWSHTGCSELENFVSRRSDIKVKYWPSIVSYARCIISLVCYALHHPSIRALKHQRRVKRGKPQVIIGTFFACHGWDWNHKLPVNVINSNHYTGTAYVQDAEKFFHDLAMKFLRIYRSSDGCLVNIAQYVPNLNTEPHPCGLST